MDVLTRKQRSYCMSRIRAKDTTPELIVRRIAHRLGHRFRLHRRDLPGTPDIVFPRLRSVVFVHGCFWHLHHCRLGRVVAKTNADFWQRKRSGNAERDARAIRALRSMAWRALVIWECQTRDLARVERRLQRFLEAAIKTA